jgi:hypothetical protein
MPVGVPALALQGVLGCAVVLQLMAACAGPETAPPAADLRLFPAAAGSGSLPTTYGDDTDQDGLCDRSEDQLRTNPDSIDSDADHIPDVIEVIGGYDPTDPTSPGPDQLGYLEAVSGRLLDLELRGTVDGNGQGATGQFSALNAFDARGLRASDFFVSGLAVSAEPPDHVRGIRASDERFSSVLGRTRLRFRVSFAYESDAKLNCAAGLPFVYAIKNDVGGYNDARNYLLIVTPKQSALEAADFCRPVACL